jgi:hypothetical protein
MSAPKIVEIPEGIYVIMERVFVSSQDRDTLHFDMSLPICFGINVSEVETKCNKLNTDMQDSFRKHPPEQDWIDTDGSRNEQIQFYTYEYVQRLDLY